MNNGIFWDIKAQFVPHRKHITSLLQRQKYFRGGDYEECRLVRHKSPVRTSQETHYVSARDQPINAV
jgi:hypothetical protein